jgi:hypothetical protein
MTATADEGFPWRILIIGGGLAGAALAVVLVIVLVFRRSAHAKQQPVLPATYPAFTSPMTYSPSPGGAVGAGQQPAGENRPVYSPEPVGYGTPASGNPQGTGQPSGAPETPAGHAAAGRPPQGPPPAEPTPWGTMQPPTGV